MLTFQKKPNAFFSISMGSFTKDGWIIKRILKNALSNKIIKYDIDKEVEI